MTVRLTHWRGPLKRAVLATIVAALTPLPLFAASEAGTPPAKPQTLKAAVQTAAVRNAAAVAASRNAAAVAAPRNASAVSAPRAEETRRADQASTAKQSNGFFRSGAGAVALAVMAVGTGYAIYSASHDKITSPAKK